METRRNMNRAAVFGLDVAEGTLLAIVAATALSACSEFYNVASNSFQPETTGGEIVNSAVSGAGAVFYVSVLLGGLHFVQGWRNSFSNQQR